MNIYVLLTIIAIPVAAVLGFVIGLLAAPKIKKNKLYNGLIKLSDENLKLKIETVELKRKLEKLEEKL